MAGKITALEAQKRARERVNVYIDGSFAFGLSLRLAASLRIGDELSDEAIARLQAADVLERAHEAALTLLESRPRSEAELRRHLRRKGFDETAVDAVLERLRQVGLVDDLAFARFWSEQRQQFHPQGWALLETELRQHGVPDPIIAQVQSEYDEASALQAAAHAQARRLQHMPAADFQKRLIARLLRRGFSYAAIRELLQDPAFAFPHLDESEEL